VKPDERSVTGNASGLGWSGSGFMRNYPSGGLKLKINYEMKSGVHDILIRYESLLHRWNNVDVTVRNRGLDCERYENSTMLRGNKNYRMCSFYRPDQSIVEKKSLSLEMSKFFFLFKI